MAAVLGFIGLGVMGAPMGRHLAAKSGCRVVGFDLVSPRVAGLDALASVEAVGETADILFLSLPGGPEVTEVAARLQPAMAGGATLVDLSTTPVELARDLAARLRADGIHFADAPVARMFRDAKLMEIGAGTSEIRRMPIRPLTPGAL